MTRQRIGIVAALIAWTALIGTLWITKGGHMAHVSPMPQPGTWSVLHPTATFLRSRRG